MVSKVINAGYYLWGKIKEAGSYLITPEYEEPLSTKQKVAFVAGAAIATAAIVVAAPVVLAAAAPSAGVIASAGAIGAAAAITKLGTETLSRSGVSITAPKAAEETEICSIEIVCDNGKIYNASIPVAKGTSSEQLKTIAEGLKRTVLARFSHYHITTTPGMMISIEAQENGWTIEIPSKDTGKPRQIVMTNEQIAKLPFQIKESFEHLRQTINGRITLEERSQAVQNLQLSLESKQGVSAPPGFVNGSTSLNSTYGRNLCPFNAAFQVLVAEPKIRKKMLQCKGTKLQIAAQIYENAMQSGKSDPLNLTEVRQEIANTLDNDLANGEQHDVAECIDAIFLYMDMELHEQDMDINVSENYPIQVNANGTYVALPEQHTKPNWRLSRPTLAISMPPVLDQDNPPALQFTDLLHRTFAGYEPEQEGQQYETRGIQFQRAPEFLNIQLKRFQNIGNDQALRKIETPIAVPLEIELPATHVQTTYTEALRYRLESFAVHQGPSLEGGHYVAYRATSDTEGRMHYWQLNDRQQKEISRNEFLSAAQTSAVQFMYVRTDCVDQPPTRKVEQPLKPIPSPLVKNQPAAISQNREQCQIQQYDQVPKAAALTDIIIRGNTTEDTAAQLWNFVRTQLQQAQEEGRKTVYLNIANPQGYNEDWYLGIVWGAVQSILQENSAAFDRVIIVRPPIREDDFSRLSSDEALLTIRSDAEQYLSQAINAPERDLTLPSEFVDSSDEERQNQIATARTHYFLNTWTEAHVPTYFTR
ncbi:MAG: hypothetical protein HY861_00460 [Chlamydiia bacterium]|nr:hypothetical protein [Chlamydiia bacterium]